MSYQPIDHLNRPPHPFWNFVADMDAAYQAPGTQEPRAAEGGPSANAGASNTTSDNNNNEQAQPQTNIEDPPEVDPATLRGDRDQPQERCRGRRRCGSNSDEEHDRRREWCGRRGWGRRGWGGPPGPFGPGFPFGGFGGPRWGPGMSRGPPQGEDVPPPPAGPGPFGPRGPGHHRGGPFHRHHGPPHGHPRGPHGHGRGPRSRSPPPPPGEHGGFDLHKFLNDLGARIGIDLASAAANLGLTNQTPNQEEDIDFEPKADIFDQPTQYTIHLSLPGAKKSDIGVDWDGEHSTLRIGGVVYRPDITEEMLSHLAVDGRKRETGVFEKLIRLGTRRDPAVVDVNGITARMRDGVLVVVVPKGEKKHERREVPIAKSTTPSPARHEELMVFDAAVDREMTDSDQDGHIQLVDRTAPRPEDKGKQAEYENEKQEIQSRESSATVEAEPEPVREQLPAYHPVDQHDVDDWEKFESGDEGEGEYVKINVD